MEWNKFRFPLTFLFRRVDSSQLKFWFMCRKAQSWEDFYRIKSFLWKSREARVRRSEVTFIASNAWRRFKALQFIYVRISRRRTPCSASIKALGIIYITFTSSHIRYYFIRKMTKAFDFITLRQTPTHVWAKRKQEFSIKDLPSFFRSSRMHCNILDCSLQPSTRHNFFWCGSPFCSALMHEIQS